MQKIVTDSWNTNVDSITGDNAHKKNHFVFAKWLLIIY
jgi:hypothetical protein